MTWDSTVLKQKPFVLLYIFIILLARFCPRNYYNYICGVTVLFINCETSKLKKCGKKFDLKMLPILKLRSIKIKNKLVMHLHIVYVPSN